MQQGTAPPRQIAFVADAGSEAGLGHVSRSSAVAVALRCRGFEPVCCGRGLAEPFERDGVRWLPMPDDVPLALDACILVVDSYLLALDQLENAGAKRLVVMHDYGVLPREAALVVSPASAPENAACLGGLEHAPLRPQFWGLPERRVSDQIRRVLVTTGSGRFDALGRETAAGIASALPEAEVTVVRGPYARSSPAPENVAILSAPDSLLDPLTYTDVVVTAGGQTMLEAAAAGTPCIALPVVENQRPQVSRLAMLGAVRAIDPPEPKDAVAAIVELADDTDARRGLSRRSQTAVDGYGALRVAFRIDALMSSERS
jgi:UDP-2,4-diacetamido-2,4,6-trideoxy-beta-L-altropyranose hydrolase